MTRTRARTSRIAVRAVVIGLGKAGGSLVSSLKRAHIRVVAKQRRLGSTRKLERALASCDVVFIAVPDDALDDVDAALASLLAREGRTRPLVVHLSGARGSEALARTGAITQVGTFHPLASLDGRAPIPRGSLIAVDATRASDRARLEKIARASGCVPARVPSSMRALYHAGAVISANLAVALLSKGVDLLVAAGVPRDLARVSLARLLRSQADNAIARNLRDALTGPVARGDARTIARHLEVLSRGDAALYRALSRVLIDDVVRHQPSVKRALRRALR